MMEEGAQTNSYINMRGEAIVTIEQTINELGECVRAVGGDGVGAGGADPKDRCEYGGCGR